MSGSWATTLVIFILGLIQAWFGWGFDSAWERRFMMTGARVTVAVMILVGIGAWITKLAWGHATDGAFIAMAMLFLVMMLPRGAEQR